MRSKNLVHVVSFCRSIFRFACTFITTVLHSINESLRVYLILYVKFQCKDIATISTAGMEDGHLLPPLCFCPFGYTGLECETGELY